MQNDDFIITAVSQKGNLVGYFTSVKNCAKQIQAAHTMNNISTMVFARALSAAVLLSGNLKNPDDRLAMSWDCTGPVKKLCIETDGCGNIRGFIDNAQLEFIERSVQNGEFSTEPYIGFGELTVSRETGSSAPYQSIVVIETGEIAQDLSLFLEQSLQIQSTVNIGLSVDKNNTIVCAGGLMLMGLPGVTAQEINELYNAFQKITNLTDVLCKDEQTVLELFNSLNMDIVGNRSVQFHCKCSAEKVKSILKSLKPENLQEFLSKENCYETSCKYCGAQYKITQEELNG